jgi:hypothetical protein
MSKLFCALCKLRLDDAVARGALDETRMLERARWKPTSVDALTWNSASAQHAAARVLTFDVVDDQRRHRRRARSLGPFSHTRVDSHARPSGRARDPRAPAETRRVWR